MPTWAPGAHEGVKERFDDPMMVSDIGVRGHSPIIHCSRCLVVQGWWLEDVGVGVQWNAKL